MVMVTVVSKHGEHAYTAVVRLQQASGGLAEECSAADREKGTGYRVGTRGALCHDGFIKPITN